jgi:hypothetical protein
MDDRSAAFVAVFQSFLEEIVDAHRRAAPAGAPGIGVITFHRRPSLTPDGSLPDLTVILLAGPSIQFVSEAAQSRDHFAGEQPLLFAVLETLDGLSDDADVAFLLTTNRASVLEPALAQRPGRVDLTVEVPLPDRAARRRLIELYARSLRFSDEALDRAAAMTEGTTASVAKELVRRSVLIAAGPTATPRTPTSDSRSPRCSRRARRSRDCFWVRPAPDPSAERDAARHRTAPREATSTAATPRP